MKAQKVFSLVKNGRVTVGRSWRTSLKDRGEEVRRGGDLMVFQTAIMKKKKGQSLRQIPLQLMYLNERVSIRQRYVSISCMQNRVLVA